MTVLALIESRYYVDRYWDIGYRVKIFVKYQNFSIINTFVMSYYTCILEKN